DDLNRIDEIITTISRNSRKSDWSYLCRHPEIRAIIRVIIMEAVKNDPQNIFIFAAELFDCSNRKRLITLINKQMKWMKCQLKSGEWAPAEGVKIFPETSSDSSINPMKTTCETPIFHAESSECGEILSKPGVCPDNFRPSC
ncbi:hypothetical protein KR222_008027, partial [Zaprionus bogoriensis]